MGLVPNEVTYTTLINGYCKDRNIVEAMKFFDEMLQKECVPNEVTYHALITGLCKARTIQAEHSEDNLQMKWGGIFYTMLKENWDHKTGAYNTVIVALCLRKKLKMAFKLKDKMSAEGFQPDGVTYAALLRGICEQNKINDVDKILSEALQKNMLSIAYRYSILFDLYFGEGRPSKATLLLNENSDRKYGQSIIINDLEKEGAATGTE